MKDVSVSRLPFGTLFKVCYISALSAAVGAVALVGILRLFITFPENHAPALMLALCWVLHLVVGPVISGFGLALCGWVGIALLAKAECIKFRVTLTDDEPRA